ncbi:MAG: N-acetyltransferase [Bacteroidales bacterium]|nr:N-acetyltransferase [Bacteroidales bacterium]
MNPKVQLDINNQYGVFFIEMEEEIIATMSFRLTDEKEVIVDHTVVDREHENQGYAKVLMKEMINYVQANKLRLVPLCAFVKDQLKYYPHVSYFTLDLEDE